MPKKKPVIVEDSFEVECINAARVTDDAQWEYNIKWGGYSEGDNSWEPESNLGGCVRMMKEFWHQVGQDKKAQAKSFQAGYKLAPPENWTKQQRDSYKKSQAKKKSQKNKQKTSKSRGTSGGNAATPLPAASSSTTLAPALDDQPSSSRHESEDDDEPLSHKLQRRNQDPATKVAISAMNIEDLPESASKRKRNDEQDFELPNKRPKIVATSIKKNAQLGATPSKKDNDRPPRPASPTDSLFGDGTGITSTPFALSSLPVQSRSNQPKEKPQVPLHVQRKQNPRVKPMALPLLDTSVGGISTKNRIVLQGNMKSSGANSARITDGVGASSSGGLHASPKPGVTSALVASESDANTWLRENIMSKEELGHAISDTLRPLSAEPISELSTAQSSLRFSKRWRWSGHLFVGDNETGFAAPVGGVVVTDSTPLDRNVGKVSMEALLPPNFDTICLRHQYTLPILRIILLGFKISQFAVMTADPSDDESSFDEIVLYMSKHELFSQCPLTIADREVATMFVFPAKCLPLLRSLGIPEKVCQEKGFIVAIGFSAYIPPKRISGGPVTTYTTDWKAGPDMDVNSEPRVSLRNRALLALSFPEHLFQRLTNKQCTIFATPGDCELPGRETMALVSVFESAPGCQIVPIHQGNARYIFIHVRSWNMLHKLPGLIDRRVRRADVQFFTYGSDPSIERKRWGVHEVFPLGGIVTFTPRAIAEDPTGVERLIAKLDEHPLWACYIIPSVIPMISQVIAEKRYPKRVVEALCSILLPIEKGQLALTWQPPHRLARNANSEVKWVDWMIDQGNLSELRGMDLFMECRERFQRQQDRSEKDVESRIVQDLLVMQSELRKEYRRFVIITDTASPSNSSKQAAATSSVSRADIKDGFELTHVKDFTFNDDYFVADNT